VDCSSICHLFDSGREDHSPIAQLVERATVNREVIGSNPVGREVSIHSSVVERAFSKRKARSSNLLECTITFTI
jgi:transcription elongation factor